MKPTVYLGREEEGETNGLFGQGGGPAVYLGRGGEAEEGEDVAGAVSGATLCFMKMFFIGTRGFPIAIFLSCNTAPGESNLFIYLFIEGLVTPHMVTAGLFTSSNLIQVEHKTKHAHLYIYT